MPNKAKLSAIIFTIVVGLSFLLVLCSDKAFAGDPIQVIKYDCDNQGQCVRNPNGRYNDPTCFNSCQPLLQTIKFGCNNQGECVRDPNGRYTSAVCSNACQSLTPDSGPTTPATKSFSQPTPPRIPTEGLPDFGQLVATIFTWSLNILGIVVFVKIFYSGFKWFTAAGNTAQVNEARSEITNAITGAIVLLAAWIILYTVNPDLVGGVFSLQGF